MSGHEENRIHIDGLHPRDVALFKNVATESAKAAVRETFTLMGLDPDDPIASQECFQALRVVTAKIGEPEFREDLTWLRRTRTRTDGAFGKALLSAIVIGVAGALQALWTGIVSIVHAGQTPGAH
jgi:hypothetical protein